MPVTKMLTALCETRTEARSQPQVACILWKESAFPLRHEFSPDIWYSCNHAGDTTFTATLRAIISEFSRHRHGANCLTSSTGSPSKKLTIRALFDRKKGRAFNQVILRGTESRLQLPVMVRHSLGGVHGVIGPHYLDMILKISIQIGNHGIFGRCKAQAATHGWTNTATEGRKTG